jgi:hypothetical protein
MLLILKQLFSVVDGSEPDPGSANAAKQLAWKIKDS